MVLFFLFINQSLLSLLHECKTKRDMGMDKMVIFSKASKEGVGISTLLHIKLPNQHVRITCGSPHMCT